MNVQYGRTLKNSNYYDNGFLRVNNSGFFENAAFANGIDRPNGRVDYQLIFLKKGTMYVSLQGVPLQLQENDFFIFAPNTPQRYSFEKDALCDYYWIHFSGVYSPALLDVCKLNTDMVYHGNNACSFLIQDAIKRITIELQTKNQNYETVAASLLHGLLANLPRYLKTEWNAKDFLRDVVAEFDRDFASIDNIAAYAKRHDLSTVYFIRTFKRYTGVTPKRYILNLRMQKAKELLSASDMKVNEIARACGFESPLYFSKLFHRYFGVPPTQF